MLRRLLTLPFWCCLLVLVGVSASGIDQATVVDPILETDTVHDPITGEAIGAKAPVIWVHPYEKSQSLVMSTSQDGRILVYDLNGVLKQVIAKSEPTGNMREVAWFGGLDIVYQFKMMNKWSDILVVTDAANDTLRFFRINPWSYVKNIDPLEDVTSEQAPRLFTSGYHVQERHHAYDLATHTDSQQSTFAIISRRHETQLAKANLVLTDNGSISFESRLFYRLPETFEAAQDKAWTPCFAWDTEKADVYGMTIDKHRNMLYVSQRGVGIWKMPLAEPNRSKLIDKTTTFGMPYLRRWLAGVDQYACEFFDHLDPGLGGNIEGEARIDLDIYYQNRRTGYLIASNSQEQVMSVYKREGNHAYLGQFKSQTTRTIDSIDSSEGLAIVSANLGPLFPSGLVVVQDNRNTVGEEDVSSRAGTNLKFISWQDVAMSFESKLQHRQYGFSHIKKWRN